MTGRVAGRSGAPPARGARGLAVAALLTWPPLLCADACGPCLPASACAESGDCPPGYTCHPTLQVCVVDRGTLDDLCSFGYRKPVTLHAARVRGQHDGFPVLVSLAADADLAARTQPDGSDLAFTAADGATRLPHELETFDPATGALVAWVRVPHIDRAADTQLLLYYGSTDAPRGTEPAAVWDGDFVGVWHLSSAGDVARALRDSTVHGNHGDGGGRILPGNLDRGQVGGGLRLDGSGSVADVGNDASLQITGAITVEGWVRPHGADEYYLVTKTGLGGNRGWDLSFDPWTTPLGEPALSSVFRIAVSGNDMLGADGADVAIDRWQQLVGVFEPGVAVRLYVDGVEQLTAPAAGVDAQHDSTRTVGIGGRTDSLPGIFDGGIDEVRVSATARSTDWIATAYANMASPAAFHSVGPEQALDQGCAGQ